MKHVLVAIVVVFALCVVGAAGCASVSEKAGEVAAEKAIEGATGANVDINKDGAEVKVQDDKGNSMTIGEGGKLPEGFPKEFPVYDGAKAESSMVNEGNGKKAYTVSWKTSDQPSAVLEFYKTELPKNGYTISNTFEMEGDATLGLKKGEENIGNIVISKNDEGGASIIASITN